MFVKTLDAFRAAGAADPFPGAKEVCGPRPEWTGWGFSTISELSKMNKTQLARKRAESDALKKKIVIPFDFHVSVDEFNPDVIEGESTEVPQGQAPATLLPRSMEYVAAKQLTIRVAGKERFMGELTQEQLNFLINKPATSSEQREAAVIVLEHDFNATPPEV